MQVVSLLENMKQELVAEGEQEQQNFDKFLGREPKKTVIHWAKQKLCAGHFQCRWTSFSLVP